MRWCWSCAQPRAAARRTPLKRVDEARAAVIAAAKDTSKSVDEIKKLTEAQKAAEQAYKDAKKKAQGK